MRNKLNATQAENLTLWIEALLSGEYEQGGLLLYDAVENTYSAQGIAARLFGFPHVGNTFYWGSCGDKYPVWKSKRPTLWNRFAVAFLGASPNKMSMALVASSEYHLPTQWVAITFGIDELVLQAVGHRAQRNWTFIQVAEYLVAFLPNTDDKAKLQQRIRDELKAEAELRQEAQSAE